MSGWFGGKEVKVILIEARCAQFSDTNIQLRPLIVCIIARSSVDIAKC